MKSGFVSFIGRPNAGKSTLLNRLVGSKLAIVSDKPQTTRTRILGVRNYPDAQVVFLDTPGIHRPLHRMNVRMVDAAVDTIREVDVLGLVVDVSETPGQGRSVRARPGEGREAAGVPGAEQDRSGEEVEAAADHRTQFGEQGTFAEIIPVSASTGENVDRLERLIIDRLPEGRAALPGRLPDRSAGAVLRGRDRAREAAAVHARGDSRSRAPWSIDRFEEPAEPGGLLRLYCTIVVDRESQKPIVVGRGGDMIKRIGTAAREELERFFGHGCSWTCTSA